MDSEGNGPRLDIIYGAGVIMKMQHAEVGRIYRWRTRDVRIIRRSPLASGGNEVYWTAIDDGTPISDTASERLFCSEAQPLVGLDDEILLGDMTITLRARFAASEATIFRSHGKTLSGEDPALHHATILVKGHEPISVPISREDYRALGGVVSG